MTDFETHLSHTPPREIPAHWREEILAAAEREAAPGKSGWWLALWIFLRGLLWPHPLAWAALVVCWLAIAGLCFSGPRGEALYTVTPPGARPLECSPESYALYLRTVNAMLRDRELREQTALDRSKL